jgi:hypothetical protein
LLSRKPKKEKSSALQKVAQMFKFQEKAKGFCGKNRTFTSRIKVTLLSNLKNRMEITNRSSNNSYTAQ